MQEFSTVTASSYDAESLAPLLTEKAAEGWDVVSIVAAGTNIVAYLRRDGSATSAPTGGDDVAATAGVAAAASDGDAAHVPTESAITAAEEPAGWAAAPDKDVAEQVGADDAATEAGGLDAGTAGVVGAAGAAAAAGTLGNAGDTVGGLADSATDATSGVAGQASGAAAGMADQATDAAAGAAGAGAATADSGVPAGWYADPSGRYELRYWDGSAWTEHVSRAGQQFTDPPVA